MKRWRERGRGREPTHLVLEEEEVIGVLAEGGVVQCGITIEGQGSTRVDDDLGGEIVPTVSKTEEMSEGEKED